MFGCSKEKCEPKTSDLPSKKGGGEIHGDLSLW